MPSVAGESGTRRSPVPERRRRQVAWSVPHYIDELARMRSLTDARDWTYYKFPTRFALRDFPTAITLEITNECNFGCPHCNRSALNKHRDIGFMSVSVLQKIAAECSGRVAEIKIIGLGEGALHPDLPEIVRAMADAGIKVRLYTNGTLFERFSPSEVCGLGLEVVVLSIDGTDKASFERLRLGGDYEATRSNLRRFRAHRDTAGSGPHIEIRHVIMANESTKELAAFKRDWLGLGGDTVKFNLLGQRFDKRQSSDEARPPCRDIRRELHIRWDGRVPLCGYGGDREWIGDVRTTPIAEIWHAQRIDEVRRSHERRDLSTLPVCKTCQHR